MTEDERAAFLFYEYAERVTELLVFKEKNPSIDVLDGSFLTPVGAVNDSYNTTTLYKVVLRVESTGAALGHDAHLDVGRTNHLHFPVLIDNLNGLSLDSEHDADVITVIVAHKVKNVVWVQWRDESKRVTLACLTTELDVVSVDSHLDTRYVGKDVYNLVSNLSYQSALSLVTSTHHSNVVAGLEVFNHHL